MQFYHDSEQRLADKINEWMVKFIMSFYAELNVTWMTAVCVWQWRVEFINVSNFKEKKKE